MHPSRKESALKALSETKASFFFFFFVIRQKVGLRNETIIRDNNLTP